MWQVASIMALSFWLYIFFKLSSFLPPSSLKLSISYNENCNHQGRILQHVSSEAY